MTETSESTSLSSAAPHAGVKRGLPADGLSTAETAAKGLWEVARLGLTSESAFAEKLGRRASGGSWRTLMALVRGFGLVREEGEQLGLSALGQAVVNDSNATEQVAARRKALLKLKAYRELVQAFDGTALPETTTLSSRLKYDYGKSDDFAAKAAQAFVDSLRHAGMVDEIGRVSSQGASTSTSVEGDGPAPEIEEERQAAEIDEAFAEEDAEGPDQNLGRTGDESYPPPSGLGIASNVTINVTLDLSKYRADEVIQILRALNG